jgi:organic radical activating enzyme
LDGIATQLEAFPKDAPVSITGGEPTDHDLKPLMDLLRGREIHMETSGIREVGYDLDWITVSPKAVDYKQRIGGALKIVVRPEWSWRQIEALEKDSQFSYKYLQPMTSGSLPLNTAQVISMVLERPEWNLSTQAHRGWKLR